MSDIEVDYLEERGPGIAELPTGQDGMVLLGGDPAEEEQQAPPVYPGWEQETVEQFLMGFGAGTHMLIGAAEKDWLMTKRDLARIAPPLTRIMNRWEPAVRMSPYADPLLVAHGFALYGWRSGLERNRALRDAAAAEGEVIDGAAYQRTGTDQHADVDDAGDDHDDGPGYFPTTAREEQ
jgi:hypothetical protein